MSPAAWGGRFLDALAFLSRLAPPRSFTAQSLAASVPWFAPAGLALGCLCTLAALGLSLWQGLVLIVAQYWLTRRLAAQARSQGGLSGDFLGAAIELRQLWFLLATL